MIETPSDILKRQIKALEKIILIEESQMDLNIKNLNKKRINLKNLIKS